MTAASNGSMDADYPGDFREQFAELDLLYRTAPIGLCFMDTDLRFRRINEKLAAINGRSVADHAGRHLREVLPDLAEQLEPIYRSVIESGEPALSFEVERQDPQGSQTTLTYLVSYYPLKGEQGHVIGVSTVVQEMTATRRIERELKIRNEAIANSVTPTAFGDAENRVNYVNQAFLDLFGFESEQQVLGLPNTSFESHPTSVAEINSAMSRDGSWSGETMTRKMDGTPLHVVLHASQVPDETGCPSYSMVSFWDITERKQREGQYRRIVETTQEWIWEIDRHGVHVYSNPAVTKLLGYTVEEVVGNRASRFLHEQDREIVAETLPGHFERQEGWTAWVLRWRHKDGGIRYLESNAVPIYDAAGEFCGFQGADRDVTALRASEERFRAIFNSTFQFIGLLDIDGNVLEANETALAFGELQPEDVLGQPFWETAWWRGDATRVSELRDAVKRAACGEFVRYQVEVEGAHSRETIDFSIKPVFAEDDHIELLVPEGRVITEQTRAEAALRASEDRFRQLVDHAPEAVVLMDLETGRFMMVNPAAERLFKMSASQLYGVGPAEVSPPAQPDGRDSKEAAAQFIGQACAGETPVFEWTHRDSQGNDIPCEVRLLSLEVAGRAVIRGSLTDIAERKQAELAIKQSEESLRALNASLEKRVAERTAALQETNAELASFAYTVSHDLRAPLRAMEGFASALSEDYGDQLDETGHEYIQHIVDSAKRMDSLVSDLLSYSRLGRKELRRSIVDLNDVVSEALQQLSADIESSAAVVQVENGLPQVYAHRSTLAQIVSNLVGNGLKFVAPGVKPDIRIWAERREDKVRLWIEDNGIGIEQEYQERIFRAFERLHGIESYPGSGIGLAVVARACERLNGSCGVESAVARGSRFWVEFPAKPGGQSAQR